MHKKLIETTSTRTLGVPYQAKMFRVASGSYAGRVVALIQTSPTEIKLTYSDQPSVGWSSLQTVASDCAENSFDACIDSAGNIQLVYSEQTTVYVVSRLLTFAAGDWTAGSKVYIYNAAPGYDPSVAIEPGGTLWVSWALFVSPNRTIQAKSSTDAGSTWGSGPTDSGDELLAGGLFGWGRVAIDQASVHVVFTDGATRLGIRSRALSGGSWGSEYQIATGSSFTYDFDVAIGDDGRTGVAWDNGSLYYREFDGFNWGAVASLVDHPVSNPQLIFQNNIPAIIYLEGIQTQQAIAKYTDRRTGTFSTPVALDNRANVFDSVFIYDASADSYEDITVPAAENTTADCYHSDSGALLKDVGDLLYLGMDDRFRYVRFELSTAGSAGGLLYSYWDGSAWQAFTPQLVSSPLTANGCDFLLWTDYASVPQAWQKLAVNGVSRFWIKIEVTSTFTTGPVGSQITAVTELDTLIFRR